MSSPDLYRDFVPRRARQVALIVGGLQLLVLAGGALVLPSVSSITLNWYDRTQMVFFSLLILVVLWRFGQVRARPDATHLVVRNLIRTTRLTWPEIVAVNFGGGAPWVSLDLDDGETLTVMAVQRADGPAAEEEARRLATLVVLGSRGDSPP